MSNEAKRAVAVPVNLEQAELMLQVLEELTIEVSFQPKKELITLRNHLANQIAFLKDKYPSLR